MNILKSKLNQILIFIIAILLTALISFNYGYDLGEHKGYVMGMKKCFDRFELEDKSTTRYQEANFPK